MSVQIEIDRRSLSKLDDRMEFVSKYYPKEVYRMLVSILFDIKLLAQKKIKKDKHIVTGRLRNSIYVKTKNQQFAKRASNRKIYSDNIGNAFDADLNVYLRDFEGAVGTNVEYAKYIEDMDSFLEFALKNVDREKRVRQTIERVKRKL